jgi:hypothetical protein
MMLGLVLLRESYERHPLCGKNGVAGGRGQLKYDGTCAETRFRRSAKRTSPFKSSGSSVQSTTGSRGVRISGSNPRYTMFRGSVKSSGYPLHSPVSPSLSLPCVTLYHHISTGLYIYLPLVFKWLCVNAEAVRNDSAPLLYLQMQWIRAATLAHFPKRDVTCVTQ